MTVKLRLTGLLLIMVSILSISPPEVIALAKHTGHVTRLSAKKIISSKVKAQIKNLTNNIILPNQMLTISGANFGKISKQSVVRFSRVNTNGAVYTAPILSWTENVIKIRVPFLTPGKYLIFTQNLSGTSNTVEVTVIKFPAISQLIPAQGGVGSQVTIVGHGFKSNTMAVTFANGSGTLPAKFTVISDSKIIVYVPKTYQGRYQVVVTTKFGRTIPTKFTIVGIPMISSIHPAQAGPGDEIFLRGLRLESIGGSVYFGGIKAKEISHWNSFEIRLKVPSIQPGNVPVVVHNGVFTSKPRNFKVLEKENTSRAQSALKGF